MPQTAALARNAAPGLYPIDEFLAAITGIEATTVLDMAASNKIEWQRPGKMRSFVPQRT